MNRIRIETPKTRRKRAWLEILPLDPRDPDVVRAKSCSSRRLLAQSAQAVGLEMREG